MRLCSLSFEPRASTIPSCAHFVKLVRAEGLEPRDIWWGAYLGMPEQMIRTGGLAQARPEIIALREAARAAHGWIMDIYMLRRRGSLI